MQWRALFPDVGARAKAVAGWQSVGLLDQQNLRRDVRNQRVGRQRVEQMQHRRARLREGGGVQSSDRRREGRGLVRQAASQDATANLGRHRQQRSAVRLLVLMELAVRGLAALMLLPATLIFGLLSALVQPRQFRRRLMEAPTRLRSSARRVRLSSKDPRSGAGRLLEASRLSLHFVREELSDMQDGFPKAREVASSVGASLRWVQQRAAILVGFEPGEEAGTEARERLAHAASLGLIAGAVVIGLFISSFQGMEAMKSSDRMSLQQLEVFGLAQLSEEAFLGSLDARGGENLLELDLAELEETALEQPWVESVEVTRNLRTQSLSFQVHERRPALLLAGPSLKLVDDRGAVFKSHQPGDPVDFPVLSFAETVDRTTRRQALTESISILHALAAGRVVTQPQLSEIRYSSIDGFTLVTRSGLPIHIGTKDFSTRLGRLERAVASGDLPLEAVAKVDLSLRDRLVVVPRSSRKARKRMEQAVKSQPVLPERRSRMLHLKRVVGDVAGAGELTL